MNKSQSYSIDILQINSLTELSRIGWEFEPRGNNEVALKCPIHQDTTPSVFLNIKKNLWKCHAASCGASGDIVSLLAHMQESTRQIIIEDLKTRYDLEQVKTINIATIEKFHSQIWGAGPLLQALRDRGITDSMIRDARLGYHDGRITIPIIVKGKVINIRRYLPGAPSNEKMRNTKGYTTLAIYQEEHLKFDTIWICGGELKALVVGTLLKEHGIGAVSVTAGEGSWDSSFNVKFKGKKVFICYDVDPGGISGAKKVATQIVIAAGLVKIINLPLDKIKYPKGDINDYIGREGAGVKELLVLMQTAKEFKLKPLEKKIEDSEEQYIRLVEATNAKYINKRIRCDTVIIAMDTTPYFIPKIIDVECVVDSGKSDCCVFCPLRLINPDTETGLRRIEIPTMSPGILEMINTPISLQEEAIKKGLQIPQGCKTASFYVKNYFTILDLRLTPQLQVTGDNKDHIVQSGYLISDGFDVELNSPYTLSGKIFPHPKTQQAILLLDKLTQGVDSLTSFKPSTEELSSLKMLRPNEWNLKSLQESLNNRYADLSANITRIFKRTNLHLFFDLTYHSCLYFMFDGRQQNGWVNCLIIGDSSQGKTETAMQLMAHYGVGVRHDCKNASAAGLLGGLQQLGNRWFVSWGIIPMHDRRLVIMEELKGATEEVLGRLTDMRSSGIAEISKIEKRRAHARTRLIMISNPRSGRAISAYNFGIEAIKELMGSQEDVRRFDFATIPAASQINPDDVNKLNSSRPIVEHKYTSEITRRCILWAWTRLIDQVHFEDGAENLCLKLAIELCSKFSEALPLCDKGTMRYKLARLSVALAAMTFSTLENNLEIILVRSCHVEFIYHLLIDEYSKPAFGYADFSKAQKFSNCVIDPEEIKNRLLSTKFPVDLITQLIHTDEININDICDWCEIDMELAQRLLSFLVRKHALYRIKRWYIKTSEFISLLKTIQDSGEAKKFNTPQKDEF